MVRRPCGRAGAIRHATPGRRDELQAAGRHRLGHCHGAHGAGTGRGGRDRGPAQGLAGPGEPGRGGGGALAGCPDGTRLEVVIEPAGPAWLPIAAFFSARGHTVFRVSSPRAAGLRRFLSRHAKSDGIDADTLARLPLFDPAGLAPLVLPGAERAALDRRVRATDRRTRHGAEHKKRIKDRARQLLPLSPLSRDLGAADLAVLERYADPRVLTRAGQDELAAVIAQAPNNHLGAERA